MLNSNVGNRGAEKGIWTKFTFPWPSEGPATDEGTSASESVVQYYVIIFGKMTERFTGRRNFHKNRYFKRGCALCITQRHTNDEFDISE